jgi:glycosyltransferase involved in cell wall biosynthesis
MNLEKILVIMPCYNSSDTLLDALKSVNSQTYKNFILICCDDKSTDNTLYLLEEYKKDLNMEYIIFKNDINLGTGNTVNYSINKFNELYNENNIEYITWISSDNILYDNFIEEHNNKLNENYAISYSGWNSFYNNDYLNKNNPQYCNKSLLHLKESYCLGPSFMFRKKLYEIAGPFHTLPGEDYYFAVNCALNNALFGYIDKPLISYRIHDNSVSGRLREKIITEISTFDAINNAQNINIVNGCNSYK